MTILIMDQAHLANGLQVYMMEDHEVPTVKAALLMKGGRHASPANKVGACHVISFGFDCLASTVSVCFAERPYQSMAAQP